MCSSGGRLSAKQQSQRKEFFIKPHWLSPSARTASTGVTCEHSPSPVVAEIDHPSSHLGLFNQTKPYHIQLVTLLDARRGQSSDICILAYMAIVES